MTFDVIQHSTFQAWLTTLRDRSARGVILGRVRRIAAGNLGDFKSVGGGVHEFRIAHGPGYRLYFIRRGSRIIVLLCGGDKGSQARDVLRARSLAQEFST